MKSSCRILFLCICFDMSFLRLYSRVIPILVFISLFSIRATFSQQSKLANEFYTIGNSLFDQGQYKNSVVNYDKALQLLNVHQNDPIKDGEFLSMKNIIDAELAGDILLKKATALYKYVFKEYAITLTLSSEITDNLSMAFDVGGSAYICFESKRVNLGIEDEIAKMRLGEKIRNTYDLMIEIIYLHGNSNEQAALTAFTLSQKSRSRLLIDLLWIKTVTKSSLISDDYDLIRELLSELAMSGSMERAINEELLNENPDYDIINHLKDNINSINRKIITTEAKIKQIKPEYNRVEDLALNLAYTNLSSFRTQLEITDVLVQYHITDNCVYVFIVPQFGEIKFLMLNITKEMLVPKVISYINRLKVQGAWKESSGTLYHDLIVEIKPYISNFDRLFIVPSGILNLLPFQTLYDPLENQYFFQQYSISILPHAELLGVCGKHQRTSYSIPPKAMIVGINDFDNSRNYLPWSEDDAISIAGLFGKHASIFLNSRGEANKNKLVKLFPNYTIVHISSHAEFSNRPMFSNIILKDDYGKDNGLTAFDILNIKEDMKPGLIVLSACGTGLSRIDGGDELFGLSYALFFSGFQTIVASLWPVEAKSTGILIREFYRNLLIPKTTVDEALSKAQESLRISNSEYKNPYFWGGFIVIGDGRLIVTY